MSKLVLHAVEDLLPLLMVMGSSLVTVGILTIIGKISLGAFLALIGGWLGLGNAKESTKIMIEAGKYRVTGEGIGVGILIAGILIILSVIVSEVISAHAGMATPG